MKFNLFRIFRKKKVKDYSWASLTIGQFQEIYDIQRDYSDGKYEDEVELVLRLLGVVEGKSYEEMLDTSISDIEGLKPHIDFLQEPPHPKRVKSRYVLGGTTYCLSDNPADFSAAQYIDFKELAKEYKDDLAGFLTVFLIPEGHSYNNGYDMRKTKADIRGLGVEDGLAIAGFFSRSYERQMQFFLLFSRRKMRRLMKDPLTKDVAEKGMDVLRIMEGGLPS